MTRVRAQHGMTMVELLVAMTVSVVVFAATLQVYEVAMRTASRTDETVNAAERGQQAMNRIVRTLRDATAWQPSRAGGAAGSVLLRAHASDIALGRVTPAGTRTTANPRVVESLRFCVGGGQLYQQRVTGRVTPAADCPDPAWTTVSTVRGVVLADGGRVFSYETGVTGVVTIGMRLEIDEDPLRGAPPQVLRGGVQLRNQNQPPSATFTVIPTAGRHLQLNASMSADPEGQLLEYAWRDNGTLLERRTTPVLDYVAATSGPHRIELTVKDPSGGQATVARQVEVQP